MQDMEARRRGPEGQATASRRPDARGGRYGRLPAAPATNSACGCPVATAALFPVLAGLSRSRSETEAHSDGRIDIVALEIAVGQSAIHL